MDELALAAGTALVSAMATQSWNQVRTAVVALWRKTHRGHPEAEEIERQLDETRAQVLATRDDAAQKSALVEVWQRRLQNALNARPDLAAEFQQLLDERLIPALPPGARSEVRNITISAKGKDHSKQFIAGGDIHFGQS